MCSRHPELAGCFFSSPLAAFCAICRSSVSLCVLAEIRQTPAREPFQAHRLLAHPFPGLPGRCGRCELCQPVIPADRPECCRVDANAYSRLSRLAVQQMPPATLAALERLGADLAVARLRRKESLAAWALGLGHNKDLCEMPCSMQIYLHF